MRAAERTPDAREAQRSAFRDLESLIGNMRDEIVILETVIDDLLRQRDPRAGVTPEYDPLLPTTEQTAALNRAVTLAGNTARALRQRFYAALELGGAA